MRADGWWLHPEPPLSCGCKVLYPKRTQGSAAAAVELLVAEMTCPVVNNTHAFRRDAQKVVGVFGDQDDYISNASNKIAIYIKSPSA